MVEPEIEQASSVNISAGQPWSVAMRMNTPAFPNDRHDAFVADAAQAGFNVAGPYDNLLGETWSQIGLWTTGQHTYILSCNGSEVKFYRDGALVDTVAVAPGLANLLWRGAAANGWPNDLILASIYNIALSEAQAQNLHDNMTDFSYVAEVVSGALFTFDDALTSEYDNRDLFVDRSITATIYVTSDWIGTEGYCTVEQLATLDALGWDVGNHSKSHAHLTALTQEEQEAEIQGCIDALVGWSVAGAECHIAYPYTGYNADTLAAMAAVGAVTGRTGGGGGSGKFIFDGNSVNYVLPSNVTAFDTTPETMMNWIKGAMNGWCIVIMLHGIVDADPSDYEWLRSSLAAVLDYCMTRNMPVLTVNDLYPQP